MRETGCTGRGEPMPALRRREFITVLGGAAATWPLAARAQQPTIPVIGFLSSRSPGESASVVAGFRQGLKEAGYAEGRNVHIAFRWAEGRYDPLPALAAELVDIQVAVIVAAGGTQTGLAAKAATSTVPIVNIGSDELAAHAEATGAIARIDADDWDRRRAGKSERRECGSRIERDPGGSASDRAANPYLERRDGSGPSHGLYVHRSTRDWRNCYRRRCVFLDSRRDLIVVLAAQHAVPTIYGFAAPGGLISYGASVPEGYRQAGLYVGRILKGEKPADLPILQPTKFELVINMKTAKALGISVPPTLIARADEVIE